MKIFLDTGNPEDVRRVRDKFGLHLDGVTTNPTLIRKAYEGKPGSYKRIIEGLRELGIRDVSAETIGCPLYEQGRESANEYLKEARVLHAVDPEVVRVKIPLTREGVKAIQLAAREGMKVNATLCFNRRQAMLAAQAGAAYVSPFIGRLYDIGEDGLALVEGILSDYRKGNWGTEVLTASVRAPEQVYKAYDMGSHIVTVPLSVLVAMADDGGLGSLKTMQSTPMPHTPANPATHQGDMELAFMEGDFSHPKLQEGMEAFLRDAKAAEVRKRIQGSIPVLQ